MNNGYEIGLKEMNLWGKEIVEIRSYYNGFSVFVKNGKQYDFSYSGNKIIAHIFTMYEEWMPTINIFTS